MHFTCDADGGIHLAGDWPVEERFSPWLLGEAAGFGIVRCTIKLRTVEGWALYRVSGVGPGGELIGKRVRRGRGHA